MRYEEIPVLSREEIERDLSFNDIGRRTIALLSAALYQPDADWIEDQCAQFLRSESFELKYAGLVGLSHLVRIHRRVRQSTEALLDDLATEADLAGDVCILRDEIDIYVRGRRNN
jgi:hypothetical protein